MAGSRLSMRKIRDVLRLQADGLSKRQIAASLGIGATAAGTFMQRASKASLAWPLSTDLDDAALEALIYPAPPPSGTTDRPMPDWTRIHAELKRPGVTLQLLWEEYRVAAPGGLSRSWSCECYRQWEKRLSPVMRQTHGAGEKVFVDYAGTTIDIVNPETGEIYACQLFVAALGASSLTYAEATLTQTLPDWIGAHSCAFAFFGGVSAMVVSDNLKSGITKACFHEPAVNRSYAEMPRTMTPRLYPYGPTNLATRLTRRGCPHHRYFHRDAHRTSGRDPPDQVVAITGLGTCPRPTHTCPLASVRHSATRPPLTMVSRTREKMVLEGRRRRGPDGSHSCLPLMKPTTCETAYFSGIEIIMCKWSGIKWPSSNFDAFCSASL